MKPKLKTKEKTSKHVKPLIAGNWKMNPTTASEAKKLFSQIVKQVGETKGVDIWLAVPHVFIPVLAPLSKKVVVGAQNIHHAASGAHTGEVSVTQAKSSGSRFTILGHSERRALGETNEQLSEKVLQAINAEMNVILCVGENVRDDHGEYLGIIKEQLEIGLSKVTKKDLERITIAYEPVWAIGANAVRPATVQECFEMMIYIRKALSDLYSEKHSQVVRVLYGGSANSETAAELMSAAQADGFLLGRASLDPKEFNKIIQLAK
jgi:triosephosphate isomerase (TIM)